MGKKSGIAAAAALLVLPAAALTIGPAGAEVHGLTADLSGAEEVPPNGSTYTGSAVFSIDDVANQICVESSISADPLVDPVVANHIHPGAAGQSNPPIVDFMNNQDTCVAASPTVIADILANPSGYYYNVHTQQFPGGGARGQLQIVTPTSSSSSTTVTTTSSSTSSTLAPTSTTIASNAVVATPRFTG
jgi:hypothetical protein